jgi:hypothetical protein
LILAAYFWATYVYPGLFVLLLCIFHEEASIFFWWMFVSDAVATLATLQISSRVEGRGLRDAFMEFLLSLYGTPLRYVYGIVLPTASAIKGCILRQNLSEWKNRPKS